MPAKVSAATLARIGELLTALEAPGEAQKVQAKLERLLGAGAAELRRAKALACLDLAKELERRGTRMTVGYIAVPLVAASLAAGEALDPALDPLVGVMGALGNLRRVYACIPAERRRAIWAREVEWMREEAATGNRSWMASLCERFAYALLDVAPEATPFLLSFLDELGEPWRIARSDGFARTRVLDPTIDAALKAWEAAHPDPGERPRPPPAVVPPKVSGAPYVFLAPGIFNKGHWRELAKGDRAQLALAAERMLGEKPTSGGHLVRIVNALTGGSLDDFDLRRWRVCDAVQGPTSTPLFDVWVFQVDNAVFFRHASLERVPVYVLQGSFMADDNDPTSAALARSLDDSAPGSLW